MPKMQTEQKNHIRLLLGENNALWWAAQSWISIEEESDEWVWLKTSDQQGGHVWEVVAGRGGGLFTDQNEACGRVESENKAELCYFAARGTNKGKPELRNRDVQRTKLGFVSTNPSFVVICT